ncbi:lytic transglycosylase domain-containing protein [Filibacter tadaridae]|uniref:Soluble lytic murein transglycosylase n=1 Tax=Filibacter tadaridae TaxID=2483811 RepID=A0A3P5XIK8_9BACL|nr:lytic transglycosylase domain-containing protein [Filibacter tadaridae]VDC27493.1 Soluble lytic murein transglycosylase precursor [Filibacter tadaridae]
MDTQAIRTLMEINALQSLGSVQTLAGENNMSSSMFQEMLGELMRNPSVSDSLTSVSSTLLGTATSTDSLRYDGLANIFKPSSLSSILSTKQPPAISSGSSTVDNNEYAAIIQQAADRYDLPGKLISSVIRQESNFNSDVVSHAGAAGLMQLMPGTAKFLGVKNSLDPAQNVMGGAKYLKQMLTQFDGNMELALAAYNAGPGNVKKYGGIPPFKETQQYVDKVLGFYKA